MVGPEKSFERKIRSYLNSLGAYNVKYLGCGMTTSGIPDLLCCVKGKFVAIEVKAENGHLSELQKYNIRKIQESGGIAFELRPSGFDEFKKEMEGLL